MGVDPTIRLNNGRYMTLDRLSIFGRVDFAYHLKAAYGCMGDTPIAEQYLSDDKFRYHCNQCLELHHIPPDNLSDTTLIGLLFGSPDYPYGFLNHFNFTLGEAMENAAPAGEETKGSLLGKLWRSLGDLGLALEIANNLPADVLTDAFYEVKPQEDKYKDMARKAATSLINKEPTE